MVKLIARHTLALSFAFQFLHALPAAADELPTEATASAAAAANVDPMNLQGAVNTTGLEPLEYLYQTGELQRPYEPPPAAPAPAPAGSVVGPRAVGAYIVVHSGWDAWHVACGESHLGMHMLNPRSGTAGYFQWFRSTAASVGAIIGNLPSEVAGFNTMVARGRRHEFVGYASDCPMPA